MDKYKQPNRILSLNFDNTRATLNDGRYVDVSHMNFCSHEAFGAGHDEFCPCMDYKEPK